jgi:small subunit ribosomal protein S9
MAKKEAVKKESPVKKAEPKTAESKNSAPLAHGVGRRKSSVARVWLRRGKGELLVNEKDYLNYFDTEITQKSAAVPFEIYPHASKYNVAVNVSGGGLSAQADAVKLGFARALLEINPEIRSLLRQHGLLTVDSRVKERKKYGQKAARRKFQFVKR